MPHPSSLRPGETNKGFEQTEMWTNFDELLRFLERLCVHTPPGVWVASTDMLLTVNENFGEYT